MKKVLIIMVVLMIAGAIVFSVGMSRLDWDFRKLDTEKIGEKQEFVSENAGIQRVDVSFSANKLEVTRGEKWSITYYESDVYSYEITDADGAFTVKEIKKAKVKDEIKRAALSVGIRKRNKLTSVLTIPSGFKGSVDIKLENGNLDLSDGEFSDLTAVTSNGVVSLKNISVSNKITVTAANGVVKIEGSKAKTIDISTDNGVITVKSTTVESLSCKTSNGNISVEIKGIDLEFRVYIKEDKKVVTDRGGTTAKSIELVTTNGGITLKFIAE